MKLQIAKTRMAEVLMVDSINSSQADFLLTHVPFRSIDLLEKGTEQAAEHLPEEEVYRRYFQDPATEDRHQLIVVRGSSGSGKSHFIRWLAARLTGDDLVNDVVLLIRRSDNTLKGTIKQLLDLTEVKNLKNREIYERLVKANNALSEAKFKDTIYQNFIIELHDEELEIEISPKQRKELIALLSNESFREKMMEYDGPIDRIYGKIAESSDADQDALAVFYESDFTLDADFCENLEYEGADKKALKLARKLIPNEDDNHHISIITGYMNQLVEKVIQNSSGIEPGDFQQIFLEIRKELRQQGKKLTLLIEDITSFTGINQDLLNALVTEHTGANEQEQLCRLRSVIGTTSEYYRDIRDNHKNRVTTQFVIGDGIIGDSRDDLVLFVAKYLNAMSLQREEGEEWFHNGAQNQELPVHVPDVQGWDSYTFVSGEMSLYPFNRNAINALYDQVMDQHHTPRYILRDIIEPAVNDLLLGSHRFLSFLSNRNIRIDDNVMDRIQNIVSSLEISAEDKSAYSSRVVALVAYWGNGTLATITENQNDIGGIDRKVFKEFGLSEFTEHFQKGSVDTPPTFPVDPGPKVIDNTPIETAGERAYREFSNMVYSWVNDQKKLINFQQIRDDINDFIYNTVNWQMYGIPLNVMETAQNSSASLIGFERQNQGSDKNIITLPADQETRRLLQCFARWHHLGKKSWQFEDAEDSIRFATGWLEKNKDRFVEAVREHFAPVPEYLQCAMLQVLYTKVLNEDLTVKNSRTLTETDYICVQSQKKTTFDGHSAEWKELLDFSYDNGYLNADSFVKGYFNLIQGREQSQKMIVHRSELRLASKELQNSGFMIDVGAIPKSRFAERLKLVDNFSKIQEKIHTAVLAEKNFAWTYLVSVMGNLGWDTEDAVEESDLKEVLDSIKKFYDRVEKQGINMDCWQKEAENLKSTCKSMANSIELLQEDYSGRSDLDLLLVFAGNPVKPLIPFVNLLQKVQKDISKVTLQMETAKNQLTSSGNWAETDPRFDAKYEEFDQLLRAMEVEL